MPIAVDLRWAWRSTLGVVVRPDVTLALADVERALQSRWPESRMDPTLDRIRALVDVLGHPERAFPAIHLTGTNGKTSTARMIDALLREQGLRTGRYTSPHLQSITERISVDGLPLAPGQFATAYGEVAPYLDLVDRDQPHPLSFFEVVTAMGFSVFADAPVDVAVVEVGLGGRWDATNVVDGRVAVVLPVSLDHTHLLGSSVEEIAAEKAGIIKPGSQVVVGPQPPPALGVIAAAASAAGASLLQAGVDFDIVERSIAVGGQLLGFEVSGTSYPAVFLPLHGRHQADNAAVAVAAVSAFLGPPDVNVVRAGFAQADSPGRLEVVRRAPTVLLDGAHNPAGASALAAAIVEEFSFRRLIGVVAALGDKDVPGLLSALSPVLDGVVATTNTSPRCLPAAELAAVAAEVFGPDRVRRVDRLDDALDAAVGWVEEDSGPAGPVGGGGVLVTGSIVTVGEARTLLL